MKRALLVAGLVVPLTVNAQAIQGLSFGFDLWGGWGPHTAQSGATYFESRETGNIFGGVSVALDFGSRVEPFIAIDRALIPPGDHVTICRVAPNGTCYGYFPDEYGNSYGVGLRLKAHDRLTVGGQAGVSNYQSRWRFVEAEAALRIAGPWAVTLRARNVTAAPNSNGEIWFRNVGFGIRFNPYVQIP